MCRESFCSFVSVCGGCIFGHHGTWPLRFSRLGFPILCTPSSVTLCPYSDLLDCPCSPMKGDNIGKAQKRREGRRAKWMVLSRIPCSISILEALGQAAGSFHFPYQMPSFPLPAPRTPRHMDITSKRCLMYLQFKVQNTRQVLTPGKSPATHSAPLTL